MLFCHGTSNSIGITIPFPSNLDYEILEKSSDNDGRFVPLNCKFEEANYCNLLHFDPTIQKGPINLYQFYKKSNYQFRKQKI